MCIRFIQLKGQSPIKSLRLTVHGFQEGCLLLATEISKICGSDDRRFKSLDLWTSLFENSAGRVETHVLIHSHSDVQSELEEDILVGILLAFMVGDSVPRGVGR